ncbi:hypothetical protein J4436_03910 [Candidatus Woesearchaeota archaeon]|nr:hypothetical protein [Candidatus Woesearchaeota archaeon]
MTKTYLPTTKRFCLEEPKRPKIDSLVEIINHTVNTQQESLPEVLTKNQFQIYRPEIERTLEKYQPEVREILANGGNLFQVIQMEIKGDIEKVVLGDDNSRIDSSRNYEHQEFTKKEEKQPWLLYSAIAATIITAAMVFYKFTNQQNQESLPYYESVDVFNDIQTISSRIGFYKTEAKRQKCLDKRTVECQRIEQQIEALDMKKKVLEYIQKRR